MKTTRRSFLKNIGVVSVGAAPPAFLTSAAHADTKKDTTGRNLVVVQLAGGNDGLNTVVPFADDAYHKARPSLAHDKNAVIKLDDHVGLHPIMGAMKELWDDGLVSVVQGVGYPNPNRSHFRSMDIWNSAQPEEEFAGDGWLGRTLDTKASEYVGKVPAMALGTGGLPLALVSSKVNVPAIENLDDYKLKLGNGSASDQTRRRRAVDKFIAQTATTGSDLAFLRQTAETALTSSDKLQKITATYKPAAEYPQNALAQQLKTVAQLIAGEMETRIFFVSLGGFDTHSRQQASHQALLNELSGAVNAFFKDLKGHGLDEQVLLATYSEFGRRVKENGSLGTDHGAASQMFVVSPACKGGIVGKHPSLADLDQGDLKHHTDFRSVYATLLEKWLAIPSKPVLGKAFAPVAIL